MTKDLVTLINPNLVQPGITPYALDILTTSLEQDGFDVHVVDLTFRRHEWRSALREYFAHHRPLLVGFTIRNTDTIYPQEQKVFLESHLEIINYVKTLTEAPLVAGGVGFSSMPFALVDYFGLDYGVKGPGELILSALATRLAQGEPPENVAGLLINEATGVRQVPGIFNLWGENPNGHVRQPTVNQKTPYNRRSGVKYRLDNRQYYENGGLGNFITKNGCVKSCTHCVEPDAKGVFFSKRQVNAVVDELEMLAGQGVHDVHSTDSEFNLAFDNAKEILRTVIARKKENANTPLHKLRLWLYCQPTPFDEEFASLLAEAGCAGINFGTDHSVQKMLDSWKVSSRGLFYTFEDVRKANQLAQEYGLLTMHDILFGMPGETIETIYQCLDDTLALNSTTVGYTLGIRIFPYSPLGLRFAAESDGCHEVLGLQSNTAVSPILLKPLSHCRNAVEYERQFMFDEFNRLRPLYYFSPELPEDPHTLHSPNGRWLHTLQLMRDYVPLADHPRVMLPTAPGLTEDDNNYADNPFLMCLVKLGYKGAFWARWRYRNDIMREALHKGLAQVKYHEEYVFSPVYS
jgi:tryptophan 2-C-methyltransferase